MSKKERSHGEQMLTIGQVNILYQMINIMFDKVRKLEIIIQKDERKEKERKGKPRDYIAEWFKWVEKVGKYLRKHILH